MKEDFQNIASLISPKAKLISADILPGGYSSDVYILNLVEGKNKKKVVLRSEAVSYTHLTLPTILLV